MRTQSQAANGCVSTTISTKYFKIGNGITFASHSFMSDKYFNIEFNHDGIHYDGIVMLSEKVREDGTPKSFHVVLNNVLFGNVHHNNGKWTVDEQ